MSLAARVALVIATISILTAILVTASAIFSTASGVRNDVDEFLQGRAEEIIDGTRLQPDRGRRGRIIIDQQVDPSDAEDLADVVDLDLPDAFEVDAEVQTLDGVGEVNASTGLAIPVSGEALDVALRLDNNLFETIEIDEGRYRVFTARLPRVGAVQVATSLEGTTSLVGALRNRLLLIGTLIALAGAALGWLIARQTLLPLGRLTAAAEHVAQTKDLDTPISVDNPNDEIGRLATSFNEMLDALASSREQQHRLVQDAAHELRTPLTSVNANIDLLMRATDLPADERQEILTRVRGELRQLGTLFTEVIELATDRQERSVHQPLDLVDVANKAVEDLARRSDNEVTVDATPSMVSGDFKALHRAVTNLLGNAVKYSPSKSSIRVTVADGTIAVEDQGSGIPLADREKIFDRFHRLEHARPMPGSGLGLAIVAKIVADHDGTTFVDDARPGPGAIVGFTLPPTS